MNTVKEVIELGSKNGVLNFDWKYPPLPYHMEWTQSRLLSRKKNNPSPINANLGYFRHQQQNSQELKTVEYFVLVSSALYDGP